MSFEIKPLEWVYRSGFQDWIAETILGCFYVEESLIPIWSFATGPNNGCGSIEEGKRLAEADYRSRLASALTPASGESGLREEDEYKGWPETIPNDSMDVACARHFCNDCFADFDVMFIPFDVAGDDREDGLDYVVQGMVSHCPFCGGLNIGDEDGEPRKHSPRCRAALANPDGGGEDADAAFMLSIGGRETTSEDDCPTRFVIEHGGFSVGLVCDMHEADLVVNDHFVKGYPTKQDVLDLCRIVGIPARSSP